MFSGYLNLFTVHWDSYSPNLDWFCSHSFRKSFQFSFNFSTNIQSVTIRCEHFVYDYLPIWAHSYRIDIETCLFIDCSFHFSLQRCDVFFPSCMPKMCVCVFLLLSLLGVMLQLLKPPYFGIIIINNNNNNNNCFATLCHLWPYTGKNGVFTSILSLFLSDTFCVFAQSYRQVEFPFLPIQYSSFFTFYPLIHMGFFFCLSLQLVYIIGCVRVCVST